MYKVIVVALALLAVAHAATRWQEHSQEVRDAAEKSAIVRTVLEHVRAGDTILWYNGDTNAVSSNSNAHVVAGPSYFHVLDDFQVANPSTIHAAFANGFCTTVASNSITSAYYEIRSGVASGSGGTVVASGIGPVTPATTGRLANGGQIEYTFIVTGLNVDLVPGVRYWLTVAPVNALSRTACSVDNAANLNRVGTFFASGSFLDAEDDAFADLGSPFSLGVIGVCSAGCGGDPHFNGFDGSSYEFMGEPGAVFNIFTSPNLHINARFRGVDVNTFAYEHKNPTFMDEFGIIYGAETSVKFSTTKYPELAPYNPTTNTTEDGGQVFHLADGAHAVHYEGYLLLHVPPFRLNLSRTYNEYNEIFVNMDMSQLFDIPADFKAHGVLGQTLGRQASKVGTNDKKKRSKGQQTKSLGVSSKSTILDSNIQGEGVIDGHWTDYQIRSGDLFGTDFKYNMFSRQAPTEYVAMEYGQLHATAVGK